MRITQSQIENRKSDFVCFPCGNAVRKNKTGGSVTAHTGVCGICAGIKFVMHIRHFGIDDFAMKKYVDPEDVPEFASCAECDGHPSCEDFGCAIESGLGRMVKRDSNIF